MQDEMDTNELNEPTAEYTPAKKKRITFFNSFEEENEHNYKMLAGMSYEERLTNLEERRKVSLHHLLKEGKWVPLSRKFTTIILPYEVCR